jgi:hypothetical protein
LVSAIRIIVIIATIIAIVIVIDARFIGNHGNSWGWILSLEIGQVGAVYQQAVLNWYP